MDNKIRSLSGQNKDEKVFYPYYPKGIADSWDYKDPLAKKLLDILDIYVRL